ncbi:hypothetical protein HMPREF1992_01693 [Selenomonas sp. oral taxon 892 str. F0426]|jgi:hypothetical protein|uniref:hypothetical protein n=1 Tax=Selenomonas sp. oral taxon 892 TaxID=1321785 RepID=UPI0003AD5903|nr:hypothetical protein [Selenomonas sp. oral taxon 892]ERJ90429.1 hypothetical protein HMPREF1992_01693 [Selenomonas sp. oral taxon 892 str. F0426]
MNAFYTSYTETFLSGLADYAHLRAGIDKESSTTQYITISQRLDENGRPLIVGLSASVDAFYVLASGYSGVSLDGMDELAVDAVGELFNVINGHFSSHMRAQGHAVSIIDPPRHHHGAVVPPTAEFSLPLTSPAGSLCLMAAREEFLNAHEH